MIEEHVLIMAGVGFYMVCIVDWKTEMEIKAGGPVTGYSPFQVVSRSKGFGSKANVNSLMISSGTIGAASLEVRSRPIRHRRSQTTSRHDTKQ